MDQGWEPMDQDLKVFRDLLLWLWENHEKPWEYEDSEARQIYADIKTVYASIGKVEELEVILPAEDRVRSGFLVRQYLYLNPIEDVPTLVPVLSIKTDFSRSIPELRLRLGLFLRLAGKTKAFGYRFESPEGPGEHHYYHAQMIDGFDKGAPFMGESNWLPDDCPTFPLDANDPVKLLLSLLIALYGIPYIAQIKLAVAGVEQYLKQMQFSEFGTFEWYRSVNFGVDHAKREVHATTDPEEFEKNMKKRYPKCEVVGITKGRFVQLDKKRTAGKSRRR